MWKGKIKDKLYPRFYGEGEENRDLLCASRGTLDDLLSSGKRKEDRLIAEAAPEENASFFAQPLKVARVGAVGAQRRGGGIDSALSGKREKRDTTFLGNALCVTDGFAGRGKKGTGKEDCLARSPRQEKEKKKGERSSLARCQAHGERR